jgi:energy-coupling factor transport system permease protein
MRSLHPAVWLTWLLIACGCAWRTRNPLYLLLIALCIALVHTARSRRAPVREAPRGAPLLRIAIMLLPLSALLNAAWARAGDTVLFRIPASIPLLGGSVTLEALAYGLLNGLMLLTLLAAFSVFNQALGARDLLGFVPRGFDALAVTSGIAITYVPSTLRQATAIREAQAIRGAALTGVRAWLPLFLPLLAGGLERAFQLAEALSARGFVAATHQGRAAGAQFAFLAGALLLAAAWLAPLFAPGSGVALALGLAGVLAIAIAFALGRASARVRRSVYRQRSIGPMDLLCMIALLGAGAWIVLSADASLAYDPYVGLTAPEFEPLIGAAILALALPALST